MYWCKTTVVGVMVDVHSVPPPLVAGVTPLWIDKREASDFKLSSIGVMKNSQRAQS